MVIFVELVARSRVAAVGLSPARMQRGGPALSTPRAAGRRRPVAGLRAPSIAPIDGRSVGMGESEILSSLKVAAATDRSLRMGCTSLCIALDGVDAETGAADEDGHAEAQRTSSDTWLPSRAEPAHLGASRAPPACHSSQCSVPDAQIVPMSRLEPASTDSPRAHRLVQSHTRQRRSIGALSAGGSAAPGFRLPIASDGDNGRG